VTTFAVRLIANIGTGVELLEGDMAVREEMLALWAKPRGANTTQAKSKYIHGWKDSRIEGLEQVKYQGDLRLYPIRICGAPRKVQLNAS